jgi:hypothetical protein
VGESRKEPTVANVLTVVWIVIAYVVMNSAMQIWAGLMLPGPVERARERVERKPVKSLFWGALILGITAAVSLNMINGERPGPVQLLGWIVAGPMLAGSIIGGAAFSQLLARRIQAQMQNDSHIQALVGGALCTTLASLLPVIGWFVFLPVVGLISIGSGFPALFARRKRVVEQPVLEMPVASPPQFVLPAQGSAVSQYSEPHVPA